MIAALVLLTALGPASNAASALAENPSIPGAAVAVFDCEVADTATAGVVLEGAPQHVGRDSRFNIGSNAKSMLATLAAVLVEEDALTWTDTVSDSAAFSAMEIHPAHQSVTLAQLLSHTSGVAAYSSGAALNTVTVTGDAAAQRAGFAALALSLPPDTDRGAFLYSNAGYVIAAEMIAAAAGDEFFNLMQERLFQPLQIDAHLGEPGMIGPGQPRGHTATLHAPQPLAPDQDAIPDFLDPAGDISVSIEGYARYLQAHVCGLGGRAGLLTADSFATLHTAVGDTDYALGWAKTTLPAGEASFHIGGTGAFTTIAALAPDRGRGAAVMMNSGGDAAQSAGVATVLELLSPTQ